MASLVEKHGYTEWLCHTNFSFLTGASHPNEYVERAVELGYQGLGTTDYDGVYGLARVYRDLARLKKETGADLNLFYGAELHLEKDHHLPIVFQNTIALIAKNHAGYHELCRICSHAHRDGKTNAFISMDDLAAFSSDNLAAIVPMRGMLRQGSNEERYLHQCSSLKEHFNDHLYFALSRHLHPSEDRWIKKSLSLAEKFNCKTLISQDPFMHAAERKPLSDLLQTVRTNKTMGTAVDHMFVNSERSLQPLAVIEKRFQNVPNYEASLIASSELADSCRFDMNQLKYNYPKEMIPKGHTPQSFLTTLVWEGAKKRYGDPLPEKVTSVLFKELQLIEKLSFADYFLTVWDIVRWARSKDILCQGRGSAANSAVCFVLGITSVDPSLFDLLFERFISVERGDPPDIDVDFEHERREEVIQYIYRRYGRKKAAMVANVITYKTKGALRAAGKALAVPETLLTRASRLLESRHFRYGPTEMTLSKLKSEISEKNELDVADDLIPWDHWCEMAQQLKGFPRHLGIHSGGFILSDMEIDKLVAQEPATMPGRTVVQWCKEDIEGLGFFKIDILALGMLSAMRKSFDTIKTLYKRELSLYKIPQDDQPTYAMMHRADTVGTFQVESRAQMSMLPRLKPKSFYDIVVEVAIIRPGPIQGGVIHPFLRRRDGLEPISFPDERLRPILARTLGVPIFQEQIMRIAMAVGDFTGGEANELRKHMGSWNIKGDISPWLTRLEKGMRKNNIDEKFIESTLNQMKGFSEYGFPESHAVSFALIAYASCYIKYHYPAVFFSSVINSHPMGFYSAHALLQAARRSGVQLLPVCVTSSDWDCTLEKISPENHPPVFAMRLGLRLVKSLRAKTAQTMVETRKKLGGWKSAKDFLINAKLYRNDLTALAASNALEIFGMDRRSAIWLTEAAPFCPVLEDVDEKIDFEKETSMERLEQDFDSTTTSLGPHPAKIIRDEYWCYDLDEKRLTNSTELEKMLPNESVYIFGMVLARQAPPSAKGMVFFTLEDDVGFINLVFTPQVYSKNSVLIDTQAFLCVRGVVQKYGAGHSIMVRDIFAPVIEEAEIVPIDNENFTSTTKTHASPKRFAKSRNYM